MPFTDGKTYVTISTDAGFKDGVVTFGIWISSEHGRFKHSGFAKELYNNSTEAELIAICTAVKHVNDNLSHILDGCDILCINTDSKAAIQILQQRTNKQKNMRFNHYYHDIVEKWFEKYKFRLHLRWVKGHSKNDSARKYVNNWADKQSRKERQNYENYKSKQSNG